MARKPDGTLPPAIPYLSMALMRRALYRPVIKLDRLPAYSGDVYSVQLKMRVFRK